MSVSELGIKIESGYVLVEDPPDFVVVWSEQPDRLQAISDVCSEAGVRKVLMLGGNTHVQLAINEVLYLGREIGKHNLTVAVVNRHDAPDEYLSLVEDVAINRGGSIRFFQNEQDAKDWLDI